MVKYIRNLNPIIIVRHAQAYIIVDPSIGGWQDYGLTPLGEEQAKAIAKRLRELLEGSKVSIYSSHLKRARETANYICNELDLEPTIEEKLQEYQTRLDPAISRIEAVKFRIQRVNPVKNWRMFNEAESIGELYPRAGEVLSEITETKHDVTLIISHGWLIDKMVAWWMGINVDDIKPNMFTTSNASFYGAAESCCTPTYNTYKFQGSGRDGYTGNTHGDDFKKQRLQ
jgi:broad specificity phosphatase PhoE